MTGSIVLFDLASDFKTIDLGQHDVAEYEIRNLGDGQVKARLPVVGKLAVEVAGKNLANVFTKIQIVLDNNYLRHFV